MKPRLLVMNQYYWPGVEATAHLLAELVEALTDDFEVTVVTGRLRTAQNLPTGEMRNGVRIVRVASATYDRASLGGRAANYVTYLAESFRAAVAGGRADVVLCMTDPPMVGATALAVARRHRAPLVVIAQDVFPEIAVELKRLTNPFVVGLLRVLVGVWVRRADRIVAIGDTMRSRLIEKGADPGRVDVIPNWVDTTRLQPLEGENAWAREQGLESRFVVMHSGNVGHAQDLDSLVRAATFLRDLEQLRIVIIGSGARHDELVALASRLEVDQVEFHDYQPRERLQESLSAASVHVVGLAHGLAGFIVPSRLAGILAVGRPVIAAADDESETAGVVRAAGCGVVVPPGRPELLAAAIRDAYEGKLELDEMGRRGRAYVTAEADREVAIRRYRALLREVVADGRR
ncbi:MAG: glycosyltransferase family 4 protein [Actinomycetota bacterium]